MNAKAVEIWRACFESGLKEYRNGHYAEAESIISPSIVKAEAVLEENEALIVDMLAVFANVKREKTEFAEALGYYEKAMCMAKHLKSSEKVIAIKRELALCQCLSGDFRGAIETETASLALSDALYGRGSDQSQEAMARLSAMCLVAEQMDSAMLYLEQYVNNLRKNLDADSLPKLANVLVILARVYLNSDRAADAETTYKEAITILQHLKPKSELITASCQDLGLSLCSQNRHQEGRAICEKVVRSQQPYGSDAQANALNDLADVYCHRGEFESARPLCETAFALRSGVCTGTPAEKLSYYALIMSRISDQSITRILRQIIAEDMGVQVA